MKKQDFDVAIANLLERFSEHGDALDDEAIAYLAAAPEPVRRLLMAIEDEGGASLGIGARIGAINELVHVALDVICEVGQANRERVIRGIDKALERNHGARALSLRDTRDAIRRINDRKSGGAA